MKVNEKENAPKVSNYLFSKKKYRNFRLVFEGKLADSKCSVSSEGTE